MSAPRCPHCGRAQSAWNRPAIIAALQAFADEHGRAPKADEWRPSSPFRPTYWSVANVFGSWTAALTAAGLEPAPARNRDPRWESKPQIQQALFEFVYEHGRTPRASEWTGTGLKWPPLSAVNRVFGSWNVMLEECGYPLRRRTPLTRGRVYARRASKAAARARAAA